MGNSHGSGDGRGVRAAHAGDAGRGTPAIGSVIGAVRSTCRTFAHHGGCGRETQKNGADEDGGAKHPRPRVAHRVRPLHHATVGRGSPGQERPTPSPAGPGASARRSRTARADSFFRTATKMRSSAASRPSLAAGHFPITCWPTMWPGGCWISTAWSDTSTACVPSSRRRSRRGHEGGAPMRAPRYR